MSIPCTRSRNGPRILLALLVLAGARGLPAHAQPRAHPLPLDPLTPAEREATERIARRDSLVRRLLAGRQADVARLEMIAIKPERAEAGNEEPRLGRNAEIVFSVLEGPHFGVLALVDLERGRVRHAERLEPAGAAPGTGGPSRVPFSPRELQRARQLVAESPEANRLLGAPGSYEVVHLGVTAAGPADPCFRGRCLHLLFRRDRAYARVTATVDLATGSVRFQGGEQ